MSFKPFIVSSHYNEDLNWLANQSEYDYTVFTKSQLPPPYIPKDKLVFTLNKGYEASSYLWYIVNNYEDIPPYVAFIHGHFNALHQNTDILTALRRYSGQDYMTLNDPAHRNIMYDNCTIEGGMLQNWEWAKAGMVEIGMDIPIPSRLEFTPSAQFITTSNRIRGNSLAFYKRCMDWLMATEFPDFISGRVFEHTWHYIMTHREIE